MEEQEATYTDMNTILCYFQGLDDGYRTGMKDPGIDIIAMDKKMNEFRSILEELKKIN